MTIIIVLLSRYLKLEELEVYNGSGVMSGTKIFEMINNQKPQLIWSVWLNWL
jgi:hypothetical protein